MLPAVNGTRPQYVHFPQELEVRPGQPGMVVFQVVEALVQRKQFQGGRNLDDGEENDTEEGHAVPGFMWRAMM